jgi:type IV pilus assembly protein PilY1
MNKKIILLHILTLSVFSVSAAPTVNPSSIPLETGTATKVKPNIMYILDDSGSMDFNYLGDEVNRQFCTQVVTATNGTTTINLNRDTCNSVAWEVPFTAYELNKIYYNPNVTYKAAIKADGTSYGDRSLTTAWDNPYAATPVTVNLNNLTEVYYCTKTTTAPGELSNPNICRRNGINHTNGTFNYYTEGYPNATFKIRNTGPITLSSVSIITKEYCDEKFINCSFTQSATAPYPAPIRWCANTPTASDPALQSGNFPANYATTALRNKPKCQKNFDTSYTIPRYGLFKRDVLTSAQYTNFANWYTFYRTRMLSMKTSVGHTFQKLDDKVRVGFVTINVGNNATSSKFLPIKDFDAAQKQAFFNKLYGTVINLGTPLREALSRVGRYYAGVSSGISNNMINATNPDPVQYSCQQNFSILSTDGYWNGNKGQDLSGSIIGNVDNVNSGYSNRSSGSYDGGLTASTESLSDVAMYYYKTDLRTTGPLSNDNVPISSSDQNPQQHMVTYAISLGLNGVLSYTPNYSSGGNTDLENIKRGFLDWPIPLEDSPSSLDDLWHATVNGRGRFYSAQNSDDIITGLNDALNALISQTGSSAAAATSSPNITSSENSLFYVTYRTVKWDGEISATTLDPATGVINPNQKWSARTLLNEKIAPSSDSRTIYYVRNGAGTSALRAFTEANMTTVELDNFKNKCTTSSLSQCATLAANNKSKINNGSTLVTYLRGQSSYDTTNVNEPLYRSREFVLGDIVNSSPVYAAKSNYAWTDAGYSNYAKSVETRAPMLYVGANDGMLHGFDAVTGQEKWAVIPSQMMNKLYKLADYNYPQNHDFFVDGSISVMDAKIGNTWKTILIAGMSSGGKGYIALDITNPTTPTVLWEMCNTSACSVVDSEMGYSYGNPIISKRKFDGKWVAYLSAGYDNSTGKGLIYEVDLATGVVLRKLYTGTGSSIPYNQSGIARINASYENFNQDNTALALYAGDLDGKVWKWDLTDSSKTTATSLGYATTTGPLGIEIAQPITTKIEIGKVNNHTLLFFGTGQFLNSTDYYTTRTQTVYAIKDNGTNYGKFKSNTTLVEQTITPGTITSTGTNRAVDLSSKNGWYFNLVSQDGERVNIDPVLTLGVLNLITNVPGNTECTAGGNAWMYQIDFATGTAVDQTNGFIAKKMSNGLIVGQVVVQLGQFGGLKNYVTDASGKVTAISVPTGQGNGNAGKIKKFFWKEVVRNK